MEHGYAKILDKGVDNVKVEVEEDFDPKAFFADRKGLYVSSDFKSRILEDASVVEAGTEYSLTPWTLTVSANDETVESALPKEHIFSESDVCALVASLIAKQEQGQEGALINDGSWNLFYTSSFVVLVGWYGLGWSVSTWCRGGSGWSQGRRVFSPAN